MTTPEEIKETVQRYKKPFQMTARQALTTFIPLQIFTPDEARRIARELTQADFDAATRRGMVKWCEENGMRCWEDGPNGAMYFTIKE